MPGRGAVHALDDASWVIGTESNPSVKLAGDRMARIEFCGGIGAGKTSCATLLAERWSLPLISERFEAVPYWKLFAQDSTAHALEKDLSFLLSHAEGIRTAENPLSVCDFAMFQTIAYSALSGSAPDTDAVTAVYRRLSAHIGHPSLVVRLHCSVDVQLRRIEARGRPPEMGISREYLERLETMIDTHIRALPDTVRVVDLDTSVVETAATIAQDAVEAPVSDLVKTSRAI
jgi:deoxyadenosine/deoxycytidine kinase